ncbi:hypothetical protein FG386_002206 [Cryptosporidium ryanae]|uniref:uncharacterized protein n=1 Tax=Cryptosporidium ryanae TaxID=515981 RepID=UPI00351A879F|nr:hypothetical protein FG386_002206 [Cryptosporidium ryanae]
MTRIHVIQIFLLIMVLRITNMGCLGADQSYLNDINKIRQKGNTGFIGENLRDGMDLYPEELEKVRDKRDMNSQVIFALKASQKITVPTRTKRKQGLDGFEVPIVKESDDTEKNIKDMRKRIDAIKDVVMGIKEVTPEPSTPTLDYPKPLEKSPYDCTKYGETEKSSITKEVQDWLKKIDLETGVVQPSTMSKGVLVKDPTLSKTLTKKLINKPNWSGSAKTLVKGVVFRDELLEEFDEEGRSVSPVAKRTQGSNDELKDESMSLEVEIDLGKSIKKDPEELSMEENRDKLKQIVTNEIPKGELLSDNNFKYEGEIFSNNYIDRKTYYLDQDPIQYVDVEDFIEKEVNTTNDIEGIKSSNAKNSRKKIKRHMKKKKSRKTEFSPPQIKVSEFNNDLPDSGDKMSELNKSSRVALSKNSQMKLKDKTPSEFGYSELDFVLETPSATPILPSVQVKVPKKSQQALRVQTVLSGKAKEESLSSLEHGDGYNELMSLEPSAAELNSVKIVDSLNLKEVPQIRGNLPKRGAVKKLPVPLPKEPEKVHKQVELPLQLTKMPSRLKAQIPVKLEVQKVTEELAKIREAEPSTVSEEEFSSEIFDNEDPSASESTKHKIILDLIDRSRKHQKDRRAKPNFTENENLPKT